MPWGRGLLPFLTSQVILQHDLCDSSYTRPVVEENHVMPPTTTRKSRYAPLVVTKNELLELLNVDFARECRAIYAHAVFAERLFSKNQKVATLIARRGQETVVTALTLC